MEHEEPEIIDRRRNPEDNALGPAAKVTTSTLKPRQTASQKAKEKQKPVEKAEKLPKQVLLPWEGERRVRLADLHTQVEGDLAWCAECAGALYVTDAGSICELGHLEPDRIGWLAAAELLYNAGKSAGEAAGIMAAAEEDVQGFYDELDARPPSGALAEVDKSSILAAFARSTPIIAVAQLFPRVSRPVLEALQAEAVAALASLKPAEKVKEPAKEPMQEPEKTPESAKEPAAAPPVARRRRGRLTNVEQKPAEEPKVEEHPHAEAMDRSAQISVEEDARKAAIDAFKRGASYASIRSSIIGSTLAEDALMNLFDQHGTGMVLRDVEEKSTLAVEPSDVATPQIESPELVHGQVPGSLAAQADADQAAYFAELAAQNAAAQAQLFADRVAFENERVTFSTHVETTLIPSKHDGETVDVDGSSFAAMRDRIARLEGIILRLAVGEKLSLDEIESLILARNAGSFACRD